MTNGRLKIDEVSVGDELKPIEIPITLQRLIMEAGANRDFSLIHHDKEVAQATGAPDAFANSFFLMGMFERLLREWMGSSGRIIKLGSMKMIIFNVVSATAQFSGTVTGVDVDSGQVELDLATYTEKGQTVTCQARIHLS